MAGGKWSSMRQHAASERAPEPRARAGGSDSQRGTGRHRRVARTRRQPRGRDAAPTQREGHNTTQPAGGAADGRSEASIPWCRAVPTVPRGPPGRGGLPQVAGGEAGWAAGLSGARALGRAPKLLEGADGGLVEAVARGLGVAHGDKWVIPQARAHRRRAAHQHVVREGRGGVSRRACAISAAVWRRAAALGGALIATAAAGLGRRRDKSACARNGGGPGRVAAFLAPPGPEGLWPRPEFEVRP